MHAYMLLTRTHTSDRSYEKDHELPKDYLNVAITQTGRTGAFQVGVNVIVRAVDAELRRLCVNHRDWSDPRSTCTPSIGSLVRSSAEQTK